LRLDGAIDEIPFLVIPDTQNLREDRALRSVTNADEILFQWLNCGYVEVS